MKTWKAVLILNNNLTNFTKILILAENLFVLENRNSHVLFKSGSFSFQAQISSSYVLEINDVNNSDKLNAHQIIQFIKATICFPHCKKKDHPCKLLHKTWT